MEAILMLIPLSALLILGVVAIFLWAVDDGQFEDVDRQGRSALFEAAAAQDAPHDHPVSTQASAP